MSKYKDISIRGVVFICTYLTHAESIGVYFSENSFRAKFEEQKTDIYSDDDQNAY